MQLFMVSNCHYNYSHYRLICRLFFMMNQLVVQAIKCNKNGKKNKKNSPKPKDSSFTIKN